MIRTLPSPREFLLVAALLVLVAFAGTCSSSYDSVTFDELSHLTSGYAVLCTGDFRLAPEHPPLAKLWAALPCAALGLDWLGADSRAWREIDMWAAGRAWFNHTIDGERILPLARAMMLALLLATLASVWWMARRLLGALAGLAALLVAALDPTLLAHGRLVTTDVPLVLAVLLALLACDAFLRRPSGLRWLGTALALSAAALTKFSWLLILPALAAMLSARLLRSRGGAEAVSARKSCVGMLLLIPAVWLAIWGAYGRYEMLREGSPGEYETARALTDERWLRMLETLRAPERAGLLVELVAGARHLRLLPEAYLYGFAYTLYSSHARSSYLDGRVSDSGFALYFPLALLYKLPPSLMLLALVGAGVLVRRRAELWERAPGLLVGLLIFTAVYLLFAFAGRLNIGIRHLLPLAPAAYVAAGAALACLIGPPNPFVVAPAAAQSGAAPPGPPLQNRALRSARRGLALVAVCSLCVSNWRAWPDYISYFNVFAGGSANGHRHLADSNLDWGQDLKRLARFAAQEGAVGAGAMPLKLAWFGSSDPSAYGFAVEALPSTWAFQPTASLTPGTYVCSITQSLGVYEHRARDEFWNPQTVSAYSAMSEACRTGQLPDGRTLAPAELIAARHELEELRALRLLNRLRHRAPDSRIGRSLWVYRLDAATIEALTAP